MNLDDDNIVDELPAPPRKDIPAADRELLELAARALGARFEEVDGEGYGNLHFPDGSVKNAWNPRQFSDDALELAVRLGILELAGAELSMSYNQVGDDIANARHAILRLAAEVGKARL